MDEMKASFVVVGAGPAGCSAAKGLIELNGREHVLLIGRENTLAYERPPLSKQSLLDTETAPQLLSESLWLIENQAQTLLNTTVISVNCAEKYVMTDKKQKIYYEKLLLTAGADPRGLNIVGHQLASVFTLRNFEDAAQIKLRLHANKKIVVVGTGFIGLEVAATAKQLGMDVTVVGLTDRTMSRTMPTEISHAFERKFKAHGVKFYFENSLTAIHGKEDVESVELQDGTVLDADLVVVGIGSYPNSEHIKGIDHLLNNGVDVDENGQSLDPHIFAAGDIANRKTQYGQDSFSLRLEAWEPARDQGRTVAEFMSTSKSIYLAIPWMWSDQFDWNLQAIGYGHLATQHIILGDQENAKFTLLQLKDNGQLMGAITLNNGKDMLLCRRALKNQTIFDLDELTDHQDLTLKQILALAKAE